MSLSKGSELRRRRGKDKDKDKDEDLDTPSDKGNSSGTGSGIDRGQIKGKESAKGQVTGDQKGKVNISQKLDEIKQGDNVDEWEDAAQRLRAGDREWQVSHQFILNIGESLRIALFLIVASLIQSIYYYKVLPNEVKLEDKNSLEPPHRYRVSAFYYFYYPTFTYLRSYICPAPSVLATWIRRG